MGTNRYKPAWELFALANRHDVGNEYPICGFELLPYVEMVNTFNGNFHYVSTKEICQMDLKKKALLKLKEKIIIMKI